jgi:predicted nucleic acid-binding protein
VTIIDANLLLYAYNADAPQQKASAQWLQELLKSREIIGLPWVTLWAFIRISTNSRIWANPRSTTEAFAIVGEWLRQPGVVPCIRDHFMLRFWKNSSVTTEQPVRW